MGKSGEYIAVQGSHETGMETEGGEHDGEGQTIVLGSEAAASLVDSNGQDMIVVIQSDDFDQSQGLIVVDPSQLQQMVGVTQSVTTASTTTTSSANGEMIVSDTANHQQQTAGQDQEYISLQMPDGSSQQGTLVLAQGGDGQDGDQSYIVVAQEDTKGGFTLQQQEQVEEKTSSSTENPQ